ncbi:MAG: HypC/HybG/HupF family hydrogenase formation chaperone [Pelolinea sp.]|nr:HypC/HybG/HupF family hydrogenase formation chaperone [Pelolinea sp.]
MCLGIPGKIIKIYEIEHTKMGRIDFSGVKLDVCLEAIPEAEVDDYVIVHAGFAISRLSEDEANETLSLLKEIEDINLRDNN